MQSDSINRCMVFRTREVIVPSFINYSVSIASTFKETRTGRTGPGGSSQNTEGTESCVMEPCRLSLGKSILQKV